MPPASISSSPLIFHKNKGKKQRKKAFLHSLPTLFPSAANRIIWLPLDFFPLPNVIRWFPVMIQMIATEDGKILHYFHFFSLSLLIKSLSRSRRIS
jgi:hypothetical protein